MDVQTSTRADWLSWRVLIGAVIIAYGLLLTAGNAGWDPAYRILDFWFKGAVAIVVGLTISVRSSSSVARAIGGLVVLVGVVWIIEETLGVRVRVERWWPLGIVAVGVLLIMRAGIFNLDLGSRMEGATESNGIAFWSGIKRRIASPAFARADFAAVMGGIEIDLRPATAAAGVAVIEVFVMWGGIEITVPPDWIVQNEIVAIMGGVDDRSSGSQGAKNTLILRGLAIMGGVEVKT
jgi:hypothetical protein